MVIDDYKFGYIRIAGMEYRSDVIVFPDRVSRDWWRAEGHKVSISDLAEVLEYRPDVLIVGTGAYGVMEVPRAVVDELESRGIEVRVAKTVAAVEDFNRQIAAGRRAAAALHLTC